MTVAASTGTIVGIVVALAVIGGLVWYFVTQRRRTEGLKSQYGPEYARTVREVGSQRAAEAELVRREERVEHLEIRPLRAEQRSAFLERWRSLQGKFVDDPAGAISGADALVDEVMLLRGYPVADFDQRAADLSVHHARVVDNYRRARAIAERHRRDAASTEDLRKAMVYYRELFQDLLEDRESAAERAVDRPVEREVDRDVDREVVARRVDDERPSVPPNTRPIDRNPRP